MQGGPGAELLALCREIALYAQISPEEYSKERVRGLSRGGTCQTRIRTSALSPAMTTQSSFVF
jgi:hypothetical protein